MTRLRDIIRREPSRGLSIPPWLDRLLSVGIVSTDPQVVRRQRCVNVAAYVGAVSGLSYIVLTSLYDLYGLLPLNAHNLMLIVPRWCCRSDTGSASISSRSSTCG